MAAQHKDWTREGQSMAFNLYCKVLFGQIHMRNNVAQASRLRVKAASRRQFQTHAPGRCSNPQPRRLRYVARNGLLLTPAIDHLFDRGFISFENGGELLISPVAHEESMNKMGIITDCVVNVGSFAEPQREFLAFHRDNVFLKSDRI